MIQLKEKQMPNIKSAIKRVNVSKKKNLENKSIKSQINTAVKKFEEAVIAKDATLATKLYAEAVSVIDSAASKKVIHKNTASRKKSRLAVKLNTLK